MGLILHRSIICTLYLIQVTEEFQSYKPVMRGVIYTKSGTEFTRYVDSSPTGVLRALIDIHGRLKMRPLSIVTEKLFENVVKCWIQQFQAKISNHEILQFQIHSYNLSYSQKPDSDSFDSRIFLLTPEKLKHWITNFQQIYGYGVPNDIIIGSCLPKFFIDKGGINMLIPVQTQNWIQPSNSNHIQSKWMKRDNVPVLVQRTSLNNWRATSLEYHMDLHHVKNHIRYLYGVLQHFSIHLIILSLNDVLGFSNVKDGKPAGLLAHFLGNVFEYLKLTLIWGYIDEKRNVKTNYIQNWEKDCPEIFMGFTYYSGSHTWPQLFRDGLTVVAKMKTRTMTLTRLISLFRYQLWIAAIVILCLLNLGFYFAFDGSPSLKHHPKFKHKSMSKLMRILGFDSLMRLQEEWTAGPTKSVRILLMAFNIYLFILLNAFLAIFSVQILSRGYFPLKKVSDVCQYQENCYMDIDAFFNLDNFQGFPGLCREKIWSDSLTFFNDFMATQNYHECLIKGSCTILTHSKKGNLAVNHYPGINHLRKPELISGMSLLLEKESIFKASFAYLTLHLRENGILQILQERHFKMYDMSNIAPEAITFSKTWLTISILALCIFAAGLIVVAENIIHNVTYKCTPNCKKNNVILDPNV